jgi:hypothetical protein
MKPKIHRFIFAFDDNPAVRCFAKPYSNNRFYVWTEHSPDYYDRFTVEQVVEHRHIMRTPIEQELRALYGENVRFVFRGQGWCRLDETAHDQTFGWKRWAKLSKKQTLAAIHAKFAGPNRAAL